MLSILRLENVLDVSFVIAFVTTIKWVIASLVIYVSLGIFESMFSLTRFGASTYLENILLNMRCKGALIFGFGSLFAFLNQSLSVHPSIYLITTVIFNIPEPKLDSEYFLSWMISTTKLKSKEHLASKAWTEIETNVNRWK